MDSDLSGLSDLSYKNTFAIGELSAHSAMFNSYPDVLDIKQLQSALRIGRNKAYELINTGTISCIRIGKNIRVPKAFLLDYLFSARYTSGVAAQPSVNPKCNDRRYLMNSLHRLKGCAHSNKPLRLLTSSNTGKERMKELMRSGSNPLCVNGGAQ